MAVELAIQKWLKEQSRRLSPEEMIAALAKQYRVAAKREGDELLLQYGPAPRNVAGEALVRDCRGLHLSLPDFSVISRSFRRFFNWGEPCDDFVPDAETLAFEKIDGSLIILYWRPELKRWIARTKGSFYGDAPIGDSGETYADAVWKLIGDADLRGLDRGLSYSFEYVGPNNLIVTPYREAALYYLAAFNNATGEEPPYEQGFATVRACFPCRRLASFPRSSVADVAAAAKALPPREEGYVVRNGAGQRTKVKNPAYVALHNARETGPLTDEKALALIESGEDAEYLAYFPKDAARIDSVAKRRRLIVERTLAAWEFLEPYRSNRGAFAGAAAKLKYGALLLRMLDGRDIEDAWREAPWAWRLEAIAALKD